jgi:hypothetical protein
MRVSICTAIFAAGLSMTASGAFAASEIQKECSQKYQAAKAANQLAGQTYNQYYKSCAAAAKAAKAGGTPASAPAATPPAPAPQAPAPTTTATKAPPAPMPAGPSGPAVFPNAISPEFASESAGKGRMHTCLAQYKANKATNGNGGLKWIQKGGGYYSECNKHLKG